MTKREDEQPEVQPTEVKPKSGPRRTYPIYYKREILAKVDRCTKPGEIGKLLRREGLYSSHLTDWRRQQVLGVFDRTEPPSRGPKPRVLDERDRRIEELEMDNALLERKVHAQTLRAQKAEAQVEFQKNHPRGASDLLNEKLLAWYRGPGPGGAAVHFLETSAIP